LIKKSFTKPELMLAIAQAESGLNPQAYNPEWHYDRNGNKVCQGSYGLFQIACVNYEGDPANLFDPELNIEIAKQVLTSQGIKAWGAFTDSRYLEYMP
jgi:soluble lytic murein transglycosylase-like protein